jgi:glycosyltransferase involved in cell wall biosynthesis
MVNSVAKYYLINAAKHLRSIKEIVRRNGIEVVVLSNLLPAYTSIKWLKKVHTVFDLSDHFPTSGAGYMFDVHSVLGRLASKTLELMLESVLRSVDCTVVCSYPLREYAKGLGAKDVTIIPNGVDEKFIEEKFDGDAIRQKFHLEGNTVIGFVGMIEFWLNMMPLLRALKKVKRKHRVKLFLVGKHFQTKTLLDILHEIDKLGICEDVVWSNGFVPYQELPYYIGAMDLCVIPFNHTCPTAYFSAPNKLWEYLAMRKPVLTSPLPDIMMQAAEFINAAVTCQDYVDVIEDYIRNPDKYIEKAEKGKQSIENHTWTKISEQYESLLKTVHFGLC